MKIKNKRAIRRNERKKKIAKAIKIYKEWSLFNMTEEEKEAWRKKQAIKNHNHLKVCNCSICSNPRKRFKGKDSLTIQELKEEESYKQQLEDIDYPYLKAS